MPINESSGLINRFSTISKGYLITIGNSLMLGSTNQTEFSGPFITTDTTQQVNGYPIGTTLNWQKNSSMAVLNLSPQSTILFAELNWHSTVKSNSIDLTNVELTPVNLTTPDGNFTISPENSQRETSELSLGIVKTFRSADITSLVANAGSGNYILGSVPSLNGTQLNVTKCGWSINIIVGNNSLPNRFLSLYSGAAFNKNPDTISQSITNFLTPNIGTVTGRVNLVVAGGDPNYYDTAFAGAIQNSLISLGNSITSPNINPGTSPNNPENNIFWGGINIADTLDINVGKIDKRGTFGNYNHDGFSPAFNNPSRNKWDITSLDLSQALTNNQSHLIVLATASGAGEAYEVVSMSFQVDSLSESLSAQKIVDKSLAFVGEKLNYTLNISNTGQIDLNNLVLTDTLQSELFFEIGSIIINGTLSPNSNPDNINLGTLPKGQTITLTYTATINKMPSSKQIANNYSLQYSYSFSQNTINSSINSNTVTTNILDIILNKTVNKSYASLGDTLTYYVSIQNTGNSVVDNLIFEDPIPLGTTFIENTLEIDGIIQNGKSPENQININTLLDGLVTVFSWKVLVNNSIPNINPISNTANITLSNGLLKSSNTVFTFIYQPDFIGNDHSNFVKTSNKTFADLGEIITYSFLINNTGNTTANNVILTDLLQNEVSFNSGTTVINGSIAPNLDPTIGINLGNIIPNQTISVSFKVTIIQIPTNGTLQSYGTLNYTYTLDPNQVNGKSNSVESNNLVTFVKHGEILQNNALKSVSSIKVTSNDTITYTISAKNTGNTDLLNVSIIDVMPIGTTFLPGTVIINGTLSYSNDPNTGINIGNIAKGATSTLRFNAKINQSAPKTLTNSAIINYSYFVDPNKQPINKSIITNEVNIYNLNSNLNLSLTSNRVGAIVGDTITYTIIANNIGDVNIDNVTIRYNLPNNVKFLGNVLVNGILSNENITIGINIGTIDKNDSILITFDVKVILLIDTREAVSYALASYTYTFDNQTLFNGSNQSNENIVIIYTPSLILSKSSNRTIAKIGDTIVYTIKIYNDGDIDIANGFIIDKIPSQLSIQSIQIDGVLSNGNMYTGLSIGKIEQGETKTIILNVNVLSLLNGSDMFINKITGNFSIITDPSFPLVSITKTALDLNHITIVKEYLSLTKKIYNGYKQSDNIISYILIVTNKLKYSYENSSLYNVVVSDLLSPNLKFIAGSIKIDNLSYPNYDILSGIRLGTLKPRESRAIMFSARILSTGADVLVNAATAEYKFIMNQDIPMQIDVISSNIVNSGVIDKEILIIKTADRTTTLLNGQIVYTITIENSSNLNIIKAIFKDTVSNYVSLIDGTFTINNVVVNSVDLKNGVVIGQINGNSTVSISYTISVNSLPSSGQIQNTANISYIYKLEDGTTGFNSIDSNTLTIPII